jgi:pyruvate,water dikinase
MTAALLARLTSGRGALGRLLRQTGFEPDPDCALVDIICGRPYYNLSRETRFYFPDFAPDLGLSELRRRPGRPGARLSLRAAPLSAWGRLPRALWRLLAARRRLETRRRTLGPTLVDGVAPMFVAEVRRASGEDLRQLDPALLLTRFQAWVGRVIDEFGAVVLEAALLAQMGAEVLARRRQGEALAALGRVRPRPEADVERLMARAAWGELPFEHLLDAVGHRAESDLELASPRWSEVPEGLKGAAVLAGQTFVEEPIAEEEDLALARSWRSLSDTLFHSWMYGWAELRRMLLALDRRLRLDGAVFWMTPSELAAAWQGGVSRDALDERRRRHLVMAGIVRPDTLSSDDLDAIGRT